MPGLRTSLADAFGSESLYEALGVAKTASAEELKRGYRKKSLIYHPDRVKEGGQETKESATTK